MTWAIRPEYEMCSFQEPNPGQKFAWKGPGVVASALGKMAHDWKYHGFETRVCQTGHKCAVQYGASSFCFVYDKKNDVYYPWGTAEELGFRKGAGQCGGS